MGRLGGEKREGERAGEGCPTFQTMSVFCFFFSKETLLDVTLNHFFYNAACRREVFRGTFLDVKK